MRLEQIWRYPVKSMIGELVPSIEVAAQGFVGDRQWAIRDEERGGIRGAKKFGGLMRLRSEVTKDGATHVHFPDGTELEAGSPALDARLSLELDHLVSLQSLPSATDLDHFRRGEPDNEDLLTELRAIFGRDEDEPLPDLSVFPPEIIEFESPPGTHHDAFPLLVMSTTALRSLSSALPDSVIDVRRFRPSIVIDTGDQTGHPEFGWVGRSLRIGEVELRIGVACPRCVMVTREVSPYIPADRAVLRHIIRELDQNVGVYATVITPGTIEEGDNVTLLD
ncbi:MAG: MOSC domain-containing protein [Actinobacteria bacterium]|uniref:Unannotated protein n=1 Tax=freshwater metagenome TaxID=449393 RepID=A0A6J7KUS6_9ZZZZ|nr:MOSC domain-containing protein [Actinomycetota bacterium]MTA78843.1 MOSC domain-containing protein [Actinomycetota bacterium]